MKRTYTLLLLLALTLLGSASHTLAQSIDLTFETGNENASLVMAVIAPTDDCWIDLNGDGIRQDNETFAKTGEKVDFTLPKDISKATIYGPITYLNLNKTALTSIDLSKISTLRELWCYTTAIRELDVTGQPDLEKLFCYGNMIKTLDLSKNTKLRELGVQYCMLRSLDLSHLPELEEAVVSGNQSIDKLDLTHNPKLRLLHCERMGITSLDLSKSPKLTYIQCSQNDLKSIDVSALPELEVLKADLIQLTELDVSHNPKLKQLHLGGNKLTTLDLSHNPLLEELNLNNNKLTSLDFLASVPNLYMLTIKRNAFTADPDFSKNPKLTYINMQRCGFKKIDLSHNPLIERLYCESNQLTELDLTKTPKLRDLIAWGNQLTALDFSQCTELQYADISLNAISKEPMQTIVNSIPQFTLLDPSFLAAGRFIAIDASDATEQNDITDQQVKVATDKGWEIMTGNNGDPQPYPGRNTVSVSQIATAETAIHYNDRDQRLYVTLPEESPATLLQIYALSGTELLSEVYDSEDGSIYVGYLPVGSYVVRIGDTTYKFVKR